MQLELASIDPRGIQQVIDQAGGHPDLALHHRLDVTQVLRQAALDDGQTIADRRQGIAQFVGERGEKQALQGIRPLQVGRALLQFQGQLLCLCDVGEGDGKSILHLHDQVADPRGG
jgi:hypothetical protein